MKLRTLVFFLFLALSMTLNSAEAGRRKEKAHKKSGIVRIINNLYLSDIKSARDTDLLKRKGIKWILDVKANKKNLQAYKGDSSSAERSSSSGYNDKPDYDTYGKLRYRHISTKDKTDFNLKRHFEPAIQFIKYGIDRDEAVLVHCNMGVSRSVSIVMAFLMDQYCLSYDQSYALVKERRREMRPNSGFEKQLKKFWEEKQKECESSSDSSSSD